MLREIRKIKARGRANHIRQLQWRKKISTHINENGFICYDPEELKKYQKTAHKGRPPKIQKGE